jgi:hypothetical protein
MRSRILVLLALTVFLVCAAQAKEPNDSKEALKQKLFVRYDQQNVVMMSSGALLGPRCTQEGRIYGDWYATRASHFHKSTEIPKAYKKLSLLDESTFVSANEQTGGFTMSFASQRFVVRKFYVRDKEVILALQSLSPGDANGVDFHFLFPPDLLKSGDYDSIVKEINQYVLPNSEANKQAEAAKKIEIQPGMSKDEVVKALGESLKTIVFGNKTVLKYSDVTVELVDNKVTEVKVN